MVGRVLTRNGITRCERGTYALVGVYELSDAERDQLLALCRQRLDVGRRSAGAEEFIHSQADVLGDLTEQRWRDIVPSVGRNGGAATTCIAELQVRSALTDKLKTQFPEDVSHLRGFENRSGAHVQAGNTIWCRPTKSLSSGGSPSSSSMAITSWRLACSSSRVSPWL